MESISWVLMVSVVFSSACLSVEHTDCIIASNVKLENSCLKIIPADSRVEYDTVVEFVAKTFQNKHENITKCEKVVGVVGELDMKTASIIHTLASRANLSVTLVSAVAPTTFLPTTNLALPNLFHLNPLTHYVEALVAFCDHLNWTRIGLISDGTYYYQFAAELLQKKLLLNPERKIMPFVRSSQKDNTTKTVHIFEDYNTDVVIASVTEKYACLLVKEARRIGLTWPNIAWIFLDVGLESMPETCWDEGMILLTKESFFEEKVVPEKLINSLFLSSLTCAVQDSSHLNATFHFRAGKRLNNISILQIDDFMFSNEIALYDAELQRLNVFDLVTANDDKPRGTILKIDFIELYDVTLQTIVVLAVFLLLFAIITMVFLLYLCFRKEPEIKATSVTVSLSIFLGCYILIAYLPLLVTGLHYTDSCQLVLWLSLGGIPLGLITSTVFVKLLRIYFVFCSNPFSLRHKQFTDRLLFLYILLTMSPSLIILVLWSAIDPYETRYLEIPQENFIYVQSTCASDHTLKWLGGQLVYYLILSTFVIFLAVKTSKTRFQNFRDSKATNAFIFLTNFDLVIILIYWYYFNQLKLNVNFILAARGILYAGHASIALLCQALLFVPKLYPPLKRKLKS